MMPFEGFATVIPPDKISHSTTDRGDKIYTSELIDKLWGKNDPKNQPSQFGDVTIDSASYVARYAAVGTTKAARSGEVPEIMGILGFTIPAFSVAISSRVSPKIF